ncbi:beta-lactamase-like protein 2 homolog [Macrosteles quadrilineatus]|uniref:beta-lactamase-like protein 2 homolog n=1 Tax=Macrosteles quadrilineatus TaxID=74068 RepID=UPI0023E25CF6|nr:beta-lactamase-like protein 2 homolog [Macrosteles quadrilineatus]
MAFKSCVPEIARLSSRVISILGCNPGPMTLQGTNTYLIGTGKRRILLDTGDENVPQYIANLSKVLKDEVCDIEHVVVSHWHHDHIGGVPDVLKLTKSDCKVWKYQQIDEDGNLVPSEIPFNCLSNGQVLSTEGASLRVIHTPGHTTDHVVLTLDEDGVLFSADTVLGEGTAVFEDLKDYMNSLHVIKDAKPKVIFPGHGPVIENPDQVVAYYIAHRQNREDQIVSVLKMAHQPLSAAEIVQTIYSDLDERLLLAAENNVIKHLIKLVKEEKVIEIDDKWQLIEQPSKF